MLACKVGKRRVHEQRARCKSTSDCDPSSPAKIMKTSILLAGETKQLEGPTALERAAGSHFDRKKLARLFVSEHRADFQYLLSFGDKAESDWVSGLTNHR